MSRWPFAARRSVVGAAAALALLGGAAGTASAQEAAIQPTEAGRKVYISGCQRCHGINLVTNGIGFDLRTFPQQDKARFLRSVTGGVRAMPAFGESLKADQLELIWAYIGSVNGWPAGATAP